MLPALPVQALMVQVSKHDLSHAWLSLQAPICGVGSTWLRQLSGLLPSKCLVQAIYMALTQASLPQLKQAVLCGIRSC